MNLGNARKIRGNAPAPDPIPRRQRCVVAAAGTTLIFSTWAMTASTPGTLIAATALAALSFALLFVPVGGFESAESARRNCSRLLRFPLFWLGGLLLAYIALQGCFPWLTVTLNAKSWQLNFTHDVPDWLPAGIDAPFGFEKNCVGGSNAWRQLCHFGSAWLLLCALWCGVRSRRLWKILLWSVLLNAILLAGFGLYRLALGTGTAYLGETGFRFFSVFSYKNHAGAFFTLAVAVCAGLGLRQWRETAQTFRHGGPHLLMPIFGLLLIGTVFATKSVGGVFCAVVWLPLSFVLIASSGLLRRDAIAPVCIFFAMFVGIGVLWWFTTDTSAFFKRVDQKIAVGELPDVEAAVDGEENPFELFSPDKGDRAERRRLSAKMFHYNERTEIFGWGAGSFRWVAPAFQQRMDEFTRIDRKTGKRKLVVRSEYAHCDPWHFFVEWGAVGGSIFLAGTAWFFGWALWNIRRWRASSAAFLAGTAIFCVHACFDFLSFNLGLLLTLMFVLAAFRADLKQERK